MGLSRQNAGAGCHALPRGLFLTQWSNPHLLHPRQGRRTLYCCVTAERDSSYAMSLILNVMLFILKGKGILTQAVVWRSLENMLLQRGKTEDHKPHGSICTKSPEQTNPQEGLGPGVGGQLLRLQGFSGGEGCAPKPRVAGTSPVVQ